MPHQRDHQHEPDPPGVSTGATVEWMQSVDKAMAAMQETLKCQDLALEDLRATTVNQARRLDEGNVFMQGLQNSVTKLNLNVTQLTSAVQPGVQAIAFMQDGMEFLGKLGRMWVRLVRWGAKIAEWGWKLAKVGGFVLAGYMFVKSILLGSSFAEAWAVLWKVIK